MMTKAKLGCIVLPEVWEEDEGQSTLPLEHTEVVAHVTGPLSAVSVTQRFGNPLTEVAELIYLFPLPADAAVSDFSFIVGGRRVKGEIEELKQARMRYDEAMLEGKGAALLEERRPSLFSFSLANVLPGETIVASVTYQSLVAFDDRGFEFVFPMGLTPRYHNQEREKEETDAPVAKPGALIGTVAITVSVDAGMHVEEPTSPSHPLEITRLDERRFQARIAGETIPNKDFVLRFAPVSKAVEAAAWASLEENGNVALISLCPATLSEAGPVLPREFVFVLDRSGSMSDGPMDQARNALKACLRTLQEGDTFGILAFDDRLDWLSKECLAFSNKNLQRADAWLDKIESRGGTEIAGALSAALTLRPDSERRRYVLFLTDGAVSAEDRILDDVRAKLATINGARLFTIGIGSSVNRFLLGSLAEVGRGTSTFIQLEEDIEEAVIRLQDQLTFPQFTNITVAWENAKVWDVYPQVCPDLYAGSPLVLTARYQPGKETPRVVISGLRAGKSETFSVPLVKEPAAEKAVTLAWVKARIKDIDRDQIPRDKRAELIALSLKHRILTSVTAWIAVDELAGKKTNKKAKSLRVAVPLPEGVGEVTRLMSMGLRLFSPLIGTSVRASISSYEDSLLSSIDEDSEISSYQEPVMFSRKQKPAPAISVASLARSQNADGSWGKGAEQLLYTAGALVVFAKNGFTSRRGRYRAQAAKAVKWLAGQKATGMEEAARIFALWKEVEGDGAPMPALTLPEKNWMLSDLHHLVRRTLLGETPVAAENPDDDDVIDVWNAAAS